MAERCEGWPYRETQAPEESVDLRDPRVARSLLDEIVTSVECTDWFDEGNAEVRTSTTEALHLLEDRAELMVRQIQGGSEPDLFVPRLRELACQQMLPRANTLARSILSRCLPAFDKVLRFKPLPSVLGTVAVLADSTFRVGLKDYAAFGVRTHKMEEQEGQQAAALDILERHVSQFQKQLAAPDQHLMEGGTQWALHSLLYSDRPAIIERLNASIQLGLTANERLRLVRDRFGPIRFLLIGGHGDGRSLWFGQSESQLPSERHRLFTDRVDQPDFGLDTNVLSPDPYLVLASCRAGQPDGVAQALSAAIHGRVIAPSQESHLESVSIDSQGPGQVRSVMAEYNGADTREFQDGIDVTHSAWSSS